jgi:hypothetical protein
MLPYCRFHESQSITILGKLPYKMQGKNVSKSLQLMQVYSISLPRDILCTGQIQYKLIKFCQKVPYGIL